MDYGLIGEKLSHSFSKEIHEQIFDYKYGIKEIPKVGRGGRGGRELCLFHMHYKTIVDSAFQKTVVKA